MEKKGTGWIPDLPDINDYTLQSQAIQNLPRGIGIESQGFTSSIEDLAQKFDRALDILENHIKKVNPGTEGSKTSNKDLKMLRDLRQEICGDFSFETVKFHNVFKVGMLDSEVILIKKYLQTILWTWPQLSSSNQQEDLNLDVMVEIITDTELNEEICTKLTKVLATQKRLQPVQNSIIEVGKDELEILKELAKLSFVITIDSAKLIPFLQTFTTSWQESWYDNLEQKDKLQDYGFGDFDRGQVYFIIHMYEMIKYLNQGLDLADANKTRASIKQVLNFLLKEEPKLDKTSDRLSKNNKNLIVSYLQGITRNIDQLKHNNPVIRESHNPEIIEELIRDYDPSKGDNDDKIYDWINKDIDELNELLNKEDKELKEGLKKKVEEWQDVIKLVYKLIPPPIAPQIQLSEEISIPSPIPPLVAKTIQSKFSSEIFLESYLDNKVKTIIEIIAQMLMPLGEHSNLSQAVEQAIQRIEYSFDEQEYPNQGKLIKFLQESFEEDNFRANKNIIYLKDKDLQEFILGAVLQELDLEIKDIKTNIIKKLQKENRDVIKEDSFKKLFQNDWEDKIKEIETKIKNDDSKLTQKSKNLLSVIYKKLQHYNIDGLEDIKKVFQIKKPQFEIQKTPESSKSINCDNKSLQQRNKNLQFPINSVLRKTINDINKKDEQTKIFLSLPEFVDLSYWCSPVEDQGVLNACTAHAGIALMEYAEKKKYGTYIDASPRFLYKVTRNLMQREGDSGASVRDMMKAMVAFGVCPEQYWSYKEDKFDEEPTPFCYSFAENYKTLKYFRIDYAAISRHMLLAQVKVLLASEIPCIFGFTLYNSAYDEVNVQRGHIPIPIPHGQDKVVGGHTVVAVGYHDRKVIERTDGEKTEGALLIRNSWGTSWGQGGYGWLPYDYIIQGLTADWWSLLKAEWLATGLFGIGQNAYGDQGGTDDGVNNTTGKK